MLPPQFEERMKTLLGKDYPLLKDELENNDAERAFRVNSVKKAPEEFRGHSTSASSVLLVGA